MRILCFRQGYMHSFAMTQNYIILPETSYLIDPCAMFGKLYHRYMISKLIWLRIIINRIAIKAYQNILKKQAITYLTVFTGSWLRGRSQWRLCERVLMGTSIKKHFACHSQIRRSYHGNSGDWSILRYTPGNYVICFGCGDTFEMSYYIRLNAYFTYFVTISHYNL